MISEQQINICIQSMQLNEKEREIITSILNSLEPIELTFRDGGYLKGLKNKSLRIISSSTSYKIKNIQGYPFDNDNPIAKIIYTKGNRFLEITYDPAKNNKHLLTF